VNWTVRVDRDEPEMSQGGQPVMRLFSESIEGYHVVGDEIDVIVDGQASKVPRQRAVGLHGATKAVVMLPKDGAPHTVVFIAVYDLGPAGLVQVKETRESDGRGGSSYTLESPVDSVSWGSGPGRDSGPGRLKLKD
jgi:hypothetical protein